MATRFSELGIIASRVLGWDLNPNIDHRENLAVWFSGLGIMANRVFGWNENPGIENGEDLVVQRVVSAADVFQRDEGSPSRSSGGIEQSDFASRVIEKHDPLAETPVNESVQKIIDSPVRSLIQQEASQPPQEERKPRKTTPLHKAASMSIYRGNERAQFQNLQRLEQLIATSDVDALDEKGNTALHLIAGVSYWDYGYHGLIVHELLEKGARVDILNDKGWTVLHTLMFGKDCSEKTVDELVKAGADVKKPDLEGRTPLHLLLEDNRRGLFHSPSSGLLIALIQRGSDVAAVDKKGNTPLHTAILSRYDCKTLSLLLDNGASLSAVNHEGDTPLHLLAALNSHDMFTHKKAVKLFLRKGADKNAKNLQAELPFHRAYERKGSEVIELLFPDSPSVDSRGRTPLHLAAGDSDSFTSGEPRIACLERFKKALTAERARFSVDSQGKTPLHYAAGNGFYEAIGELLPFATSDVVNAVDEEGNTALFHSVWTLLGEYRHGGMGVMDSDLPRIKEIFQVLSAPGKRLEIDENFSILLSTRAKKTINVLLDAGANPHVKNKKGETAISFCQTWISLFGCNPWLRSRSLKD